MTTHRTYFFLLIVLAFSVLSATAQTWTDPSPHRARLVAIDRTTKLEVLDWGGKGAPVVFIAGLGNTPHVFDDYAPQFTNSYHVYGITRRGFGASSQPPATNLRQLAADTRVILDSLRIPTAIFICHSFGGDEMSKFASMYPERVRAIVYLDAAYDRVGLKKILGLSPAPPLPTATDSASIENMQRYYQRILPQILFPLGELKSWFKLATDGRIIGDITPDSVAYMIVENLEHPAYRKIKSPALSFYARPLTVEQLFPYYADLDSVGKANAVKAFRLGIEFTERSRTQFGRGMKSGKVIIIPGGHHYIFMSNRDQVTKAIRDFLKSL